MSLERRLAAAVPASLRELLASGTWPEFLRTFSNNDEPLTIAEMGTNSGRWRKYDASEAGVLPFMFENQGVCTWAVPLNGGEDPCVLIEVDSGDPPTWQTAAESFSLWLRCQVDDHVVLERAMFAAQAEPLSGSVRARLNEGFTMRPSTFAWPAREIIRLRNDLGDLLLWNGDEQCDWWIAPDKDDKAAAILNALPVSPNLPGWVYELRTEAKPFLDAWRRRIGAS